MFNTLNALDAPLATLVHEQKKKQKGSSGIIQHEYSASSIKKKFSRVVISSTEKKENVCHQDFRIVPAYDKLEILADRLSGVCSADFGV